MNDYKVLFIAFFVICISSYSFASSKSIGAMSASEAAELLESIGEESTALEIRTTLEGGAANVKYAEFQGVWSKDKLKPYQHTHHVYGFVSSGSSTSSTLVEVKDAANMAPDVSLKKKRIKITLDRLRVMDYPGRGINHILFDFYAKHQTPNVTEGLRFSQTYRAQEGEGAGITGYPIFIGLLVPEHGLAFECKTVNVLNEGDEKFLEFMNGDTFKSGLQLMNTSNPLSPVVTSFATGIAKSIAERNKNVLVQEFFMGLDFDDNSFKAKLREGSYIVVQQPDLTWNWSEWVFNPAVGQIVSKADHGKTIPYNYVVFSVSKM